MVNKKYKFARVEIIWGAGAAEKNTGARTGAAWKKWGAGAAWIKKKEDSFGSDPLQLCSQFAKKTSTPGRSGV